MNSETTDDDCCGWASASSTTKFGWSKLEFLRKNTGIVWDCFTYIFTIYLNCWFGFRNHPQARWFLLISRSYFYHIGISINGGTRKSSILMGFSITNQPFRGTPIYGNPQVALKLKGRSHRDLSQHPNLVEASYDLENPGMPLVSSQTHGLILVPPRRW